mmetsp:Transcript_1893/g.4091  ORF Transcript_1893/g.4091 Transcript_1893/m.4091 type:complete len:86 (-) Transcript_1893:39-296(-)
MAFIVLRVSQDDNDCGIIVQASATQSACMEMMIMIHDVSTSDRTLRVKGNVVSNEDIISMNGRLFQILWMTTRTKPRREGGIVVL